MHLGKKEKKDDVPEMLFDSISEYITHKEFLCVTKGKRRYWASKNVKHPLEKIYTVTGGDLSQLSEKLRENSKIKYSKRVHFEVNMTVHEVEYIQLSN
ncbi:hypothetical protein FACS189418_2110 [Clostridia bacterium]|nr:hypothetical protein FACS189418_2110 [Clostridia bacterium]